MLMPLADGLKLLVKEDIVPAKADPFLYTMGPVLVVVPVFVSYLIVPFGQTLLITDLGVGIFSLDRPFQYCSDWIAHVGVLV